MHHSFNLNIGYHLSQAHEEEKNALQKAFHYARSAKMIGADMRGWIRETNLGTKALFVKLQENEGLTKAQKVWEVAYWESEIITRLRNYMNDTSDFLNQLKPLNPPLRSEQIRPFTEAIEADRRITLDAMAILSQTAARLSEIKAKLIAQQSPST